MNMNSHMCRVMILLLSMLLPIQGYAQLASALLPVSRSVQVGSAATAFATIINTGSTNATGCAIAPTTALPMGFSYQVTDAATNAPKGMPNIPVDIAAGGLQSYVISLTPSSDFPATDVTFDFNCSNTQPATIVPGLNTLLLSASNTPVADIVALAATTSANGITNLSRENGTGVFAVAAVNVGTTDSITASVDTGAVSLPLTLSLCQTNPVSGACLSAPGESVTTSIAANATPTFGVFMASAANVPFDPGRNRVFLRFRDAAGNIRGSTSVAVRTDPVPPGVPIPTDAVTAVEYQYQKAGAVVAIMEELVAKENAAHDALDDQRYADWDNFWIKTYPDIVARMKVVAADFQASEAFIQKLLFDAGGTQLVQAASQPGSELFQNNMSLPVSSDVGIASVGGAVVMILGVAVVAAPVVSTIYIKEQERLNGMNTAPSQSEIDRFREERRRYHLANGLKEPQARIRALADAAQVSTLKGLLSGIDKARNFSVKFAISRFTSYLSKIPKTLISWGKKIRALAVTGKNLNTIATSKECKSPPPKKKSLSGATVLAAAAPASGCKVYFCSSTAADPQCDNLPEGDWDIATFASGHGRGLSENVMATEGTSLDIDGDLPTAESLRPGNFTITGYQNFDGTIGFGTVDPADADIKISGSRSFPTFSWSNDSVIAVTASHVSTIGYAIVAEKDGLDNLVIIRSPLVYGDYGRNFTLHNPAAPKSSPALVADGVTEYSFALNALGGFATVIYRINP